MDMQEYLKKIPGELRELINITSSIAANQSVRVYLVGGFVRDLLLGAKNLDLDIAVEGQAIRLAELISARLNARLIRHKRFGTATVMARPHLKIDLASARREVYPECAQLPEVSAGSLHDDLSRRDFSINAMALGINRDDFGRLVDLFCGRDDLKNRKIRVLHELSFSDDPTRILRAIRFEQRFKFRIEPKTLKLLKQAVSAKMLDKVHPHRLRDEIILLLKENRPLKYLKRTKALAGFDFISPGLAFSKKAQALIRSAERQVAWFKDNFPNRRQLDNWVIYFMALAEPLSPGKLRGICNKFGFRKGETKRMLSYKQGQTRISRALSQARIKPAAVFGLLEPLSYETILMFKAKYSHRRLQQYIEEFFTIYNGMRTYVSGDYLQKLGLAPGPFYQQIFSQVLKAKLNGRVKTNEEELALARKLARDRLK